jgi:type III restriction enzyme
MATSTVIQIVLPCIFTDNVTRFRSVILAGVSMVVPGTSSASWIEKTPGVCGGDACIRRTRHTIAGLVQWKRQGVSDLRILEHHPNLTHDDLQTAWEYYQNHREEIDQAIQADEDA